MSFLLLKDITLELSSQPGHFIEDIVHLIMELHLADQFINTNLISRETRSGTWDADQALILSDMDKEFTVSIFIEFGGEDRQMLGYTELTGLSLLDRLGDQLEIPLLSDEPMVLKTTVEALSMDDVRKLGLGEQVHERVKKPTELANLMMNALHQAKDFQKHGSLGSLEQILSQVQLAVGMVSDDDPMRSMMLEVLGECRLHRFLRLGNNEDLEDSITQLQQAVDLTPNSDPERPGLLNNLGTSLQSRFERFGNKDDIDNSIARLQAAIELTPEDHPNKPIRLTNLGNSFAARFKHFGNIDDIDNAVAQLQAAVSLTRDGEPDKSGRLHNLGNSLMFRFQRFGNADDIDRAIASQQAAVDLMPIGHPDKSTVLNSLGSSLLIRFSHSGNVDDIDGAIIHKQAAVDLTPDGHPHKSDYLNNLGGSFRNRFNLFKQRDDIDRAIAQQEAAIKLSPDGHPHRPIWLNNLGGFLTTRFEQYGNLDDSNKAITHQSLTVDITPSNHLEYPRRLSNLGNSFFARFRRFHRSHDAEAAISRFSAAAKSPIGSPFIRLEAAKSWIRVASMIKHQSLLAAYECALAIIPLVAWLGLSIKDRHKHLVGMGNIARDAAATAISLQQYDKAVEWLEQGRSIVWTQILQLRTPVDKLRDADPKLADDLLRVSRLLDVGDEQNGPLDERKMGKMSQEEEGRRYRALAEEWERIVKKVRELPDFQDFLAPPRFSRLLGAARDGPVVVVNIAKKRCDALALINGLDEVMHIPLPDFTLEMATQLQDDLRVLLNSSGLRVRAKRDPDPERGSDAVCKRILGELWFCLVKPVLESLAFSSHPDTLPRIWWCVTGPLAFLPIHAAGVYDDGVTDKQIRNCVISSYTPTLSALLDSSKATDDTSFRMLSVIEPSIGRWHIPNTRVELEHIRQRLKGREHAVIEGAEATKERVVKAVKECNWLHLACHGSQEMYNPTKSGLKLRDGDLTLEEIIKLDLPRAEFAFLSACQTVTGDETLSEEAAHIAGGMLLAGHRSVVATMWSIEDKLAPEVADEFYAHLMKDGERPDSRKTAEALHLSIEKLRRKPGVSMVAWIPFVHLGG